MPLTDALCKNARCPDGRTRQRYVDSSGLYLEALPAGGKHWRWKYRFAGKEKRLAIGTYPMTTLAQARRARDDARRKLADGVDPVQAKLDAKLAIKERMGTTFEGVSRAWFEHWRGPKSPRHAAYVMRRLEADVFPVLGAKPIRDVTAPQLLAMAKKIESRGALDMPSVRYRRAARSCAMQWLTASWNATRPPTSSQAMP